jgi:hypothetical protein
MAFSDDLAVALADSLGVSVDGSSFESAEAASQMLSDFRSFVEGLDDVSKASLNAVVEAGIDISDTADEEGPLDLPGAPLFALAATAQRPVDGFASIFQQGIDTAMGQA